MRWSPAMVAKYAREAAFRGDDLVTAVAVALATSAGDDAYHDLGHPGPHTDARGLWGIDVAVWPQLARFDLWQPAVNAQAAYKLARDAVTPFEWAGAFRSGAYRATLDVAAQAVLVRHPVQTIPGSAPSPGVDQARLRAHTMLDGLRGMLDDRLRRGGH